MYYTGIGSRLTSPSAICRMKDYAYILAKLGLTLRSGAAPGADEAFEAGCDKASGSKEIFLPWKGFQNNCSPYYTISEKSLVVAEEIYGPRFKKLKQPVKLLMARDCYQVSGLDLDTPSKFVLCWTPDGCSSKRERTKTTGGTGQAISYAWSLGIPIFNLQREGTEDEFLLYLNKEFGNLNL